MNCRTVYPPLRVPSFALWRYYISQSLICVQLKIEFDEVWDEACRIIDKCLFTDMMKENIKTLKRHPLSQQPNHFHNANGTYA